MPHNWPRQIPGNALQTAVYTRITADTGYSVYDYVPKDAATGNVVYPYVSIGEALDDELDTTSGYGTETTMPLHVWCGPTRDSHEAGWKELNTMMDAVMQSLVDGSRWPAVAGFYVYDIRPAGPVRRYREEDGVRHGVVPLLFRLTQE